MHGTLHLVPAAAPMLHRIILLEEPLTIEQLTNAVGGQAKLVPDFDSILRGDEIEPCLVFCNANASRQELSHNTWANLLWLQALVRRYGFAGSPHQDALRGPIVIVFGDVEFLNGIANATSHNSRL